MNSIPPPLPVATPAAPAPAPRRSRTWVVLIIAVLLLLLGISVMMNAGLSTALSQKLKHRGQFHTHAVDEFPSLTEVWSYGSGDTKVARIAVQGMIIRETQAGLFSTPINMVDSVLAQIRAAQADPEVRALIVEVDSPGGGITASDEIYRALNGFRDSDEERVVVVFMRDLAASGGYYVAMGGDWLIAQPTTVLGSIGVIMQSINMKGLSEKIGIHDVTIKSGANKDLLNPFTEVDPAQRALLQQMIDAMFEHFLGIVQENRPIPAEDLRKLADGRLFVAPQALDLKLVDQIGYWEDAMARTAELLEVDAIKVVRYEQHIDFFTWLTTVKSPLHPSAWMPDITPRFQYLWNP